MKPSLTSFLSNNGYASIPFKQNAAGLLIVNAMINEVMGLFILDTGAGTTVVDEREADYLRLSLDLDSISYSGGGAGGHSLAVIPCRGNKMQLGNYIAEDFTVAAMNLEHAKEALAQQGANETLHGIIGVDILKPAKAIIDYGTMTLHLAIEHLPSTRLIN